MENTPPLSLPQTRNDMHVPSSHIPLVRAHHIDWSGLENVAELTVQEDETGL